VNRHLGQVVTERRTEARGADRVLRSPARVQGPPTGNNVPDLSELAQLWCRTSADASSGAKTPQAAMDALAPPRTSVMGGLAKSGRAGCLRPEAQQEGKSLG